MPVTDSKKRKAAADASASSGTTKKRAAKKQQKSPGAELIDEILSSEYNPSQNVTDFKNEIIELAEYARSLEEIISNGGKPVLSSNERRSAVSELTAKIARDIEKAMKVCFFFKIEKTTHSWIIISL